MTADPQLTTARVERRLPAPPSDVYEAWLDEATLALFIAPPPGTATAAIDPRVGGSLRIEMAYPDRLVVIEGEYLLLDRPSRISFTWRVETQLIDSVVTVTFEPAGADETLMTILHTQLPPSWVESYDRGWGQIAESLAGVVATAGSE